MNKIIMISIAIGMLFSTIGMVQRVSSTEIDCAPRVEVSDMPAGCKVLPHEPRFRLRR